MGSINDTFPDRRTCSPMPDPNILNYIIVLSYWYWPGIFVYSNMINIRNAPIHDRDNEIRMHDNSKERAI